MDMTSYTTRAQAWEYIEDHAFARQSPLTQEIRAWAEESGIPQGPAAQGELLRTLVHITAATSVISVGTGSIIETLQMIEGMEGTGQLTAVDSSTQGIALVRRLFARLSDNTQTSLRAVNANPGIFLPRLNGGVYDLIVVGGDASNYAATFDQAHRLLKSHGIIAFTDVLAFEHANANGGVLNPADRSDKTVAMRDLITLVEEDERFVTTLTPSGSGLLIAVKR